MKYALGLVALVATLSFAGATFSGGCSETFTIKGYAKAWYYMFGAEGSNPESSFRGYNWTTLMGRLNDHTYAYLGTNYKTWDGNSSINVCDLYLSMDIIPELNVTAGQFKIPLGWAYNRSGGSLYFLDRAGVASAPEFSAYAGRDVGVNLHGQFDMVGLDVGYFNGTGTYTDADTTVNKQIAAKLTVEPMEWLTFAAGVAMIGQPDHIVTTPASIEIVGDSVIVNPATTVTVDEWSGMGINAYVLADYPLSDNADLIFEGEYWQMGYTGPDMDNVEEEGAMDYYATLGVNIGLENAIFSSIMPAVRYETYSPQELVASGAERAEDNLTWIDFCVNCHINPYNTIQIGGRNVSYEDENAEGFTDIYLGWRLNY